MNGLLLLLFHTYHHHCMELRWHYHLPLLFSTPSPPVTFPVIQVYITAPAVFVKLSFHWWGPTIGSKRLNYWHPYLSYKFGLVEFQSVCTLVYHISEHRSIYLLQLLLSTWHLYEPSWLLLIVKVFSVVVCVHLKPIHIYRSTAVSLIKREKI